MKLIYTPVNYITTKSVDEEVRKHSKNRLFSAAVRIENLNKKDYKVEPIFLDTTSTVLILIYFVAIINTRKKKIFNYYRNIYIKFPIKKIKEWATIYNAEFIDSVLIDGDFPINDADGSWPLYILYIPQGNCITVCPAQNLVQ